MATFGRRSREKLNTVRPELRAVLEKVIQHVDFTVLYGRRGREEQEDAYAKGHSHARWPKSKHNCPLPADGVDPSEWAEDEFGESSAVDVAPWPIDWSDKQRFAYLGGLIMATAHEMGIKLRWGNDWDGDGVLVHRDKDERLADLGHFELLE